MMHGKRRPSKYCNHRVEVDGQEFDSKREYQRYCELLPLSESGAIQNFTRQKNFELIPKVEKMGPKTKATYYRADFYYVENGVEVVEDVKSPGTKDDKVYLLKKKLMMWRFPQIDFREIVIK